MAIPSYEDMLKRFGLKENDMNCRCSEETIRAVAPKMTKWRLDYLSLGQETVDKIEREFRHEDERQLNYLKRWIELCAFNATYKVLVQSFMKAGNASLAELVCKECEKHLQSAIGEFVSFRCSYHYGVYGSITNSLVVSAFL